MLFKLWNKMAARAVHEDDGSLSDLGGSCRRPDGRE